MKKIALMECNLDLLTLSLSYVFFETLVLKSAVNKMNRKVCAGASLILAAKLNDVKGTSLSGLIEVKLTQQKYLFQLCQKTTFLMKVLSTTLIGRNRIF